MKLDRNITVDGRGKYGLILVRKLEEDPGQYSEDTSFGKAISYTFPAEAVDWGDTPATDFFVIRLRDAFAAKALYAYASAIEELVFTNQHKDMQGWIEYAEEIRQLARKSSTNHPDFKLPD